MCSWSISKAAILGFHHPLPCYFSSPFFPKTCDTKLICINWYHSHDLYDFCETMFFQNAICYGIYVAPLQSMEERNEERKAKKVGGEQCEGLKSLFNHPSWHHCCHQQTTLLPAKHYKKKKKAKTLRFLAIPWWTSNLLCKSPPIFASVVVAGLSVLARSKPCSDLHGLIDLPISFMVLILYCLVQYLSVWVHIHWLLSCLSAHLLVFILIIYLWLFFYCA